jgi:diguanylate cyclase (GGDEF)-like protein
MHPTLLTIYLLAVGTLLASAGMTLWERRARPERRQVLGIWSAGYGLLAAGCLIAIGRGSLPGASGAALSNLVILAGYLMVLHGLAVLNGRQHRRASLGLLGVMAVVWALGGARWQAQIWAYVSAFPIALISAATVWEVMHSDPLRPLRTRRVVIAVEGFYALFYAGRSFLLPGLTALYGQPVATLASTLTMYAGVLYSVVLPMALLALVREEAHERLLTLALTDYLTGLGNRQWFFEQGQRLIAGSRRPLSLLAFDMDHFKAINDCHGHATGDEVLRSFATVLRAMAGADAVLARIGGEEFVALLPGCASEQARLIGQAVVHRFADTAVLARSGIAVRTTVSVGLAESAAPHTDLASLLSVADGALYAAKALGRNRVEQAETLAAPSAVPPPATLPATALPLRSSARR